MERSSKQGSPQQAQPLSEYEYNNLKDIENLRHEVITDKTLTYHDSLFKIIIIGDTGIEFYYFDINDRYWKVLCTKKVGGK